tara:strand:- start:18027 stop:19376 length:1350 start_codon:yes stop_codon:yes gene_type:complete
MFKSYLSRDEFIDFKKGLIVRTRIYFNSILENCSFHIDHKEYEYFYTFLLPILIELDYFHYVSARKIYRNSKDSFSIKRKIINFLKIILSKISSTGKKIDHKILFDKFFEDNNIDKSKILSLNYFFRHHDYLNEFKKRKSIVDIDNNKINKLTIQLNAKNYFRSPFLITNTFEKELITAINFFINFRKCINFRAKLLLFSAHSWVNSNLSRLLISYTATQTNIPIIALQAGFGHQHLICIGQVIWERYVSNKFATWSESFYEKDFFVGTMYANKSAEKNNFIKETLVLPQVPCFDIPRCFSSYWGMTKNDYKVQMIKMLDIIENILSTSEAPLFRIKHLDLNFYSKTVFKHFKNVKIDYGNINKSENFKSTKKTYIFYLSTAIVQSVYSGSETYGIFSNKENFLDENTNYLLPKECQPFECEDLTKKLCIENTKEEYIDKLLELVRVLI